MGYNMANPTGPNRGMSPGVNDHHEPGPNCTEECQPGLSEPTDPQTRAADMMVSFFWAHSPEYVDHVAAKLAEAGLLADPEERSRLIAAHQKAARFADQNYEQWQKAEVERDAAREELDAANEALAVADAQYKADTEALDAARAELEQVKAERVHWQKEAARRGGEAHAQRARAEKGEARLARCRCQYTAVEDPDFVLHPEDDS